MFSGSTHDKKKTLGQVAYESYRNHQNGKAYNGQPIPEWKDVRDDIKQAWNRPAETAVQYDKDRRAGLAD